MATFSGGKMKYQVGDLFIQSRFAFYKGVLCKIDKDVEKNMLFVGLIQVERSAI